jgi:hypothetical protein
MGSNTPVRSYLKKMISACGPERMRTQYCSYDYHKKLQAYGLRPSMSGKGNCYDNASV